MHKENKSTPVPWSNAYLRGSSSIMLINLFVSWILILLTSGNAIAQASYSATYRYKLEISKDGKVCHYMEKVYNKYFRTPWYDSTFPVDVWQADERARNMFPRLPGVDFDRRVPIETRYARFPSSQEFEAIKWQEGRIKSTHQEIQKDRKIVEVVDGAAAVLIANFDIDNDGSLDTVIQTSFLTEFAGHSWDGFLIIPAGKIDFSQLGNMSYGDLLHVDGARITDVPNKFWYSLRPFVFDDVVYLSGTRNGWPIPTVALPPPALEHDYMEILKYQGGGEFAIQEDGYNHPPLRTETICRFRMIEVHQPSKGK